MGGPSHYRAAERLLADAAQVRGAFPPVADDYLPLLAAAQVHATLAHAAAYAIQRDRPPQRGTVQ